MKKYHSIVITSATALVLLSCSSVRSSDLICSLPTIVLERFKIVFSAWWVPILGSYTPAHPCLILLVSSICYLSKKVNYEMGCPNLLQKVTFRLPAGTCDLSATPITSTNNAKNSPLLRMQEWTNAIYEDSSMKKEAPSGVIC
ncbi:hypothetical protein J6590_050130 [Homalodisca vitripennis]|nr:hypothetical protein J6590_050130 [Homalodisca vitripennis]